MFDVDERENEQMRHHLILHYVAKMMMPFILVFALYVQFHGDFGPGGGFQAGVMFGACFILYGIIFGIRAAMQVAPQNIIYSFAAFGVLLYVGTGVAGMILGGEFLNYSILLDDSVAGQHLGILLVEAGVGITVASVMISLFYCYTNYRGHNPDDEEPQNS